MKHCLGHVGCILRRAGNACKADFDDADRRAFRLARIFFHLSAVLPCVAYHGGGRWLRRTRWFEREPRFPATISWTIRHSAPKHAFHALWAVGWASMIWSLWRHDCHGALAFALQMVFTGLVATELAPVGVSQTRDRLHYSTSFLYMLNHIVIVVYLDVKAGYSTSFCVNFALFMLTTLCLRRMKYNYGIHDAPDASNAAIRATRAKLDPLPGRLCVGLEALEMIFEYALFVAFVQGLDSSLAEKP